MRLIDADSLTEALKKDEEICELTIYDIKDAYLIIDSEPTVDPVKHGKWCNSIDPYVQCSICGYSTIIGGKYCSHCGAKMEGEEE